MTAVWKVQHPGWETDVTPMTGEKKFRVLIAERNPLVWWAPDFAGNLSLPDEQRLAAGEARFAVYLATIAEQEGVRISTERLARFSPVVFDAGLTDVIETCTKRRGLSYRRMTSGAGHDAQMMARIAPAAMIFVPSRGGISHNPREHTDDDQLVRGAQILLDVVAQRLGATT